MKNKSTLLTVSIFGGILLTYLIHKQINKESQIQKKRYRSIRKKQARIQASLKADVANHQATLSQIANTFRSKAIEYQVSNHSGLGTKSRGASF